MPNPIDASAIPGANLRPDMVEIAATEMSGIGDKVGAQAATVLTTWQRLSGVYEAPEAPTLFGVMDPVKANGETFDANMGEVARALKVYAAEVEPIKAELARIKLDAYKFLTSIAGGVEQRSANRMGDVTTKTVEWHEDGPTVAENNALIGRVNDQMELLWAAERKCANAIYDIIGFPHISAASESSPHGYGLEEIPEGAETPWGQSVEKTANCGEKTAGAVKGFLWDGVIVDGLWGTVVGLGTLTLGYNPQTGEWFSGDAYAAGWSNLGMLAVGLATVGPVSTPLIRVMPGPVGDFLRRGQDTLVAAGKGLIAYDMWSEDPARAAGATVFNLGTLIIPVGAATAPVRVSASTAAAAIRTTARVVNLLDPVTLIGRGGSAALRFTMPSVADALARLDFGTAGSRIDIPDMPNPRVDIPSGGNGTGGGGVDIPVVERPDMTVNTPRTEGDVYVPVRRPQETVSAPVREPALVGAGNGGGPTVTTGTGGPGSGRAGSVGTGSGGVGSAGGGDLTPTSSANTPGSGTVSTVGSAGTPGGTGTLVPGGAGGAPGVTSGTQGGGGVPGGTGSLPGGTGGLPGGNGGAPTGTGGLPGSGGADVPANGSGNGGGTTGSGAAGGGTPWHPKMGDPTLSPADHGPGFERDLDPDGTAGHRGNPVDLDYGQPRPPGSHGQLSGWQVPPSLDDVPPEVRELVRDEDAPYGRDQAGQPYTKPEFEERYTNPDGSYRYPGNDGAVPGSRIDFDSVDEFKAQYSDVLDRMGRPSGEFMSFPGTPFEHRGLPGSNLEGGKGSPYLTIRIVGELPPNTKIEVSEIAPAFGREGGGLQVRVIEFDDNGKFVGAVPVDLLRRDGFLRIVGDTSDPGFPPMSREPGIFHSNQWDSPNFHDDGSRGTDGPGPDGDITDGGAAGGSDPNAGPLDGPADSDPADGVGDGDGRLNGAGAEPGLDPTPENIRTGMVRMEEHPDYPATVARLEDLGYTVREVGRGEDPHVSIVHVHDGAKGPVIGVERTVNVVPGMRHIDFEHEVGHVEQMTDTARFPDGPPASRHGYYDDQGRFREIKTGFSVLTRPQNVVVEYHVRLQEYLRLQDRGAPAEVLERHLEGVLDYRDKYLRRTRHDQALKSWRDAHFEDLPALEARFRRAGGI